jgi:cytochrome c
LDRVKRHQLRWLIPVAVFVAFVMAGYTGWGLWLRPEPEVGKDMSVRIPDFSSAAQAGRAAYERSCARCHGVHGAGSASGPPLVHSIYRPALHADVAFNLAVQRGVRAHHWRFGDMPPQPDLASDDIVAITRYIRELQVANAIQ